MRNHANRNSFKGTYRSFTIEPNTTSIAADQFLLSTSNGIRHIPKHCLQHGENIKAHTVTNATMQKINVADGTVEKEASVYFSNKAVPIQTESEITEFIDNIRIKQDKSIEKYTSKGSN